MLIQLLPILSLLIFLSSAANFELGEDVCYNENHRTLDNRRSQAVTDKSGHYVWSSLYYAFLYGSSVAQSALDYVGLVDR